MSIIFWGVTVLMLLLAIAILVLPLLKTRNSGSLAYKDSNLKINDEKIDELDVDLKEGRIDQVYYAQARDELDRELLIDIPAENQQTAALHYTNSAQRHPVLALVITVFVPALVMLLYLEIGMHSANDEAFVTAQQQPPQKQQPQKQLSVEEMAIRLETRINKNGGTAKEWTMLGRAHKHLGRYALAAKAFNVALETETENPQLMLEAAEMVALSNKRIFTPEASALVHKAYALEPDNMNALWFVGVAEYQNENYRQAIQHLVRMLPMVSKEQEVFRSVVGVIAKSREKLVAAGNEMPELEVLLDVKENSEKLARAVTTEENQPKAVASSLKVTVDVSSEARDIFDASDLVFIYAKAKQGPRMPLAVQRVALADLPVTVVLDDSMAMIEGMNISSFNQLEVSARVTKSGTAIAQSGDYIGRVDVDTGSNRELDIVIDTLVP